MKKLLFVALLSFMVLSCVDKKKVEDEATEPDTIEAVEAVEVEAETAENTIIEGEVEEVAETVEETVEN